MSYYTAIAFAPPRPRAPDPCARPRRLFNVHPPPPLPDSRLLAAACAARSDGGPHDPQRQRLFLTPDSDATSTTARPRRPRRAHLRTALVQSVCLAAARPDTSNHSGMDTLGQPSRVRWLVWLSRRSMPHPGAAPRATVRSMLHILPLPAGAESPAPALAPVPYRFVEIFAATGYAL
ncbi:hypothetical protein DFH09DRAFT_1302649 [Mycena vulgaris]|nr:hypothetical protein DFH09DRAFT_1302649 [Mycena vulgaris]